MRIHTATQFFVILESNILFLQPILIRPWARKIGQLWYEIFDFSCNRSPEELAEVLNYSDTHQLIMCMHPHGIVPFHAGLWAAYADQYLSDKASGRALYGFGAAADAVAFVPGLRNIMGWLSAGSATYKVLKDGITKVNRLTEFVNPNTLNYFISRLIVTISFLYRYRVFLRAATPRVVNLAICIFCQEV